jgi:lipopolysaccharide transport system permease protein
MAIIFSIIFSYFIKMPTDGVPHIVFFYAGMLPWTFFATSVTSGAESLVANLNIVTKIYLPREILPLAAVSAAFFDFLVASLVYAGLALIYRVSVGPSVVLLPFLVIVQFLFTASVALVVAALNVFYRDIRLVIPLAVQIYLYTTPVIYPLSLVPQSIVPFYMLNPMASLIHSYRLILVYGRWPDPVYLGSTLLITVFLLLTSYAFFTARARDFADVI